MFVPCKKEQLVFVDLQFLDVYDTDQLLALEQAILEAYQRQLSYPNCDSHTNDSVAMLPSCCSMYMCRDHRQIAMQVQGPVVQTCNIM